MNALRLAALFVVIILAALACAAPRPNSSPEASMPPSMSPTASVALLPRPSATPAAVSTAVASTERVSVTLTDAMLIDPASMSVPAGRPITFVVTNAGKIPHEFTLGNAVVQDVHEQEMLEMGGMPMTHDEPNAISVAPGETKELVYTFASPGMSFAGCHVPGHYPAGMKAEIHVTL